MDDFLQFVATKDYYRVMLLDALSYINSTDSTIQLEKRNILQEVARLDKLVPLPDDYERMCRLSTQVYDRFRLPPNLLFLFLPTSFDQRDPANTANGMFRLYFLCCNTDHKDWIRKFRPLYTHIQDTSSNVLMSSCRDMVITLWQYC